MLNLSKLIIFINTVRYLKPIQVYQRIVNYIKKFIPIRIDWNDYIEIPVHILRFKDTIQFPKTNNGNSFEFLNIKKNFPDKIDWNFLNNGLLWTYNLNYFDYLNQKDMSSERGMKLIESFIQQLSNSTIGLEPYPLSLRCVNWIRFFICYSSTPKYDFILYKQLNLLTHNLEYHILGNHLLENSFALLFGAYYFNDYKLYKEAKDILIPQLKEQILPDGGHFELSPMYHSTMLFRMLDCYNLVLNNELFNKELEPLFRDKSQMMLSWINMITFKNGNIPLMNDAAFNIAPIPKSLNEYALRLGLDINIPIKLNESGYRKLESSKFELIADVGNIGPDYQPGHAHADTFNFELYVNGRPVIIDTGTSTYEVNNIRFYERGTSAHNTVVVNDTNSSQVWSGHRVAKRAKVKIINDLPDLIVATHNGYQSFGQTLKRTFQKSNSCIRIIDELENKGDFYLHFSPNEEIEIVDKIIIGKDFQIEFIGGGNIECFLSEFSPEFNKKIFRKSIRIAFSNKLETLFK